MFGWMKKKSNKKDMAVDVLKKAIERREEAIKNAKHRMDLILVDKRFINIPVEKERRATA